MGAKGGRREAETSVLSYTFVQMISLSKAIDGFESYLADERRFSPRTVTAYRGDLDRFAAFWEEEFAHQPGGEVDVLQIQSRGLGNAEARGVEQLEEGALALGKISLVAACQELFGGGERHGSGQAPGHARRRKALDRILDQMSFPAGPPEKRAQRRKMTR